MPIPHDCSGRDSERISRFWEGLETAVRNLAQSVDRDVLDWIVEHADNAAFEAVRSGIRDWLKEADQEHNTPHGAYRAAAIRMHVIDGECEIDDGAPVSLSTDIAESDHDDENTEGAYVQAWVFVYKSDVNNDDRKFST